MMFIVKLQDFARQCGVTDRAIQKHLNNYAAELDGLYERRGSNGTWLSDEACRILKSKMKQNPVVVADNNLMHENEELQKEVGRLKDKLIILMEKLQEQQNSVLQASVNQILLEDAQNKIDRMSDELVATNRKLGAAEEELSLLREELERPISFIDWWKRRK